jgi:hypothetical protein
MLQKLNFSAKAACYKRLGLKLIVHISSMPIKELLNRHRECRKPHTSNACSFRATYKNTQIALGVGFKIYSDRHHDSGLCNAELGTII